MFGNLPQKGGWTVRAQTRLFKSAGTNLCKMNNLQEKALHRDKGTSRVSPEEINNHGEVSDLTKTRKPSSQFEKGSQRKSLLP